MTADIQINNSASPTSAICLVGDVALPRPAVEPGRGDRSARQRDADQPVHGDGRSDPVPQDRHICVGRESVAAGADQRRVGPVLRPGTVRAPEHRRPRRTIEVRAGATLVGSVALMVRVRKNANTLTPASAIASWRRSRSSTTRAPAASPISATCTPP